MGNIRMRNTSFTDTFLIDQQILLSEKGFHKAVRTQAKKYGEIVNPVRVPNCIVNPVQSFGDIKLCLGKN